MYTCFERLVVKQITIDGYGVLAGLNQLLWKGSLWHTSAIFRLLPQITTLLQVELHINENLLKRYQSTELLVYSSLITKILALNVRDLDPCHYFSWHCPVFTHN